MLKTRRLIVVLVLLVLPIVSTAQTRAADLVVINAKVRTMQSKDSIAEAFAISGDRISSVGTNELIRKLVGPSTRVIDAKGQLVIPGFNDAHVHFMGIGNSFSSMDLSDAKSSADVEVRIAHYVRFLPKGRWILGRAWNDSTPPDKAAVDKRTPDNPVFIYHADGQSAFANRVAFRLAGVKDESNGLVRGDALARVAHAVPANHTRNWIEIAETATNYAASLGVTSVQDMQSDDPREIYRELLRRGKLKTRVYDCIALSDWKRLTVAAALAGNDSMVRGGCLKGFSDGDQGAASKLSEEAIAADRAGLQIVVHAIGNSANRIVLDVFGQTVRSNGKRDRRLRVEHAHNPAQVDLVRFSRLNVIASMQPHLFTNSSGGYYSSLLKLNTQIAFGSDAAITDLDPSLGIHGAVNAGGESISVYQAVRAYTFGSAYAEFQEKEKGTIEIGKLADFVILSEDIFSIDSLKIRNVSVEVTVVDGRIVHQTN